jgi:cytidylate kinase
MAVIAMTREMATLGRDVSAGLAERLGLTIVHHEIVGRDIAERAGMRESEVNRFLEGQTSLLDRWRIDSKRLSRYTAQEILELAAKGNVLIRGWGASYLLRSVPHVVCVRICAPMAFREKVLMERLGINDAAAARREIERNDAAHYGAVQKMFGGDWREASLYAIVLNTAQIPVEQCVDQIVQLTQNPAFQETAQSRSALMDELILSRVREALEQRFGAGLSTIAGIDVKVSAGKVTLMGGASDDRMIVEALRITHSVEGVLSVESKIAHIAFVPPT